MKTIALLFAAALLTACSFAPNNREPSVTVGEHGAPQGPSLIPDGGFLMF